MPDIGTYINITCRQLDRGDRKKSPQSHVCIYCKLEYDGNGIKDQYTVKDRQLNTL